MRRVVSVILLILGGWILVSASMMSWMVVANVAVAERLGMLGFMTAFAMPFLLLGMWASPGNRFADIGLTMMIAAGVSAFMALAFWMIMSDPGFKQLLPPDRPMPEIRMGPGLGLANLLIVGGSGWLLWRFGRRTHRNPNEELEHVFGDG
jgi:hypothetical protein